MGCLAQIRSVHHQDCGSTSLEVRMGLSFFSCSNSGPSSLILPLDLPPLDLQEAEKDPVLEDLPGQ